MSRQLADRPYPSPSLKLRDLTFQLHGNLHSHSLRFLGREGYNTTLEQPIKERYAAVRSRNLLSFR